LPETVLRSDRSKAAARSRLVRLVARAPEVMVKVTGRTRDPGHLQAHVDYISRNGQLEAEDRDGNFLVGRQDIRELAQHWSLAALADPRRRANTPLSHSIILSMPVGTDPIRLRDAGRAFAAQAFGQRFDYVFVLHTDTPRPHLHLSVRSQGDRGERLNPKKVDLEAWRQMFAEALRERGVAAEATPRRARGVTRKAERTSLRKLRDRHGAGLGPMPRRLASAVLEAAGAAFQADRKARPWEVASLRRQARVRSLYTRQARLLASSTDPEDKALARELLRFVAEMPPPASRRLALARELRAANTRRAEPARWQDGRQKEQER
jgi:hypothetical protein